MSTFFYVAGAVAILATLRVVTATVAVHALLYLVVSLLAVGGIFFAVGAPFAGILEVIVYAGAIMVLFVFVVMMLNLGPAANQQEKAWLRPGIWTGPAILCGVLLLELLRAITNSDVTDFAPAVIDAKTLGITLYGPYILAVELSSMLLLAALIAAFHLGRQESLQDSGTGSGA